MPSGHLRGHKIEWNENSWMFSDTREPTVETWEDRPCGNCGRHETPEGHDACLGTLPGVMNACCGHGDHQGAYVQLHGGKILRRREAVEFIKELKGKQ